MTDYEYYLQNTDNINTVSIKQLIVNKELNELDYQYIYDITDSKNNSIVKCGWVIAIIFILIVFIALSNSEIDSDIVIFILLFTVLTIIACTYIIALFFNINNIQIYKETGVLIGVKSERAYIYNK